MKLNQLNPILPSAINSEDKMYLIHKIQTTEPDAEEEFEDKKIDIGNLAEATPYDNTNSGLTADNVKDALDELAAGGREVLNDLTDVTITSPAANQLLQYNSTNEQWENKKYIEGTGNVVTGTDAHAEGNSSTASGSYAHAEGYGTVSSGRAAHTEGYQTQATTYDAHAEGRSTQATGECAHAEGGSTVASGWGAHTEGYVTTAQGECSHAEGYYTQAIGKHSHAEGNNTIANSDYSHAEGNQTVSSRDNAHAEGYHTEASGSASHAEGWRTTASGNDAHSEGSGTIASGNYSHAEGMGTTASGDYSHSGGQNTNAIGTHSFAHGNNLQGYGFTYDFTLDLSSICDREDDDNYYFDNACRFDGSSLVLKLNSQNFSRFSSIYVPTFGNGFGYYDQTSGEQIGGGPYTLTGPIILEASNNFSTTVTPTSSAPFELPANSYVVKETFNHLGTGTGYSGLTNATEKAEGISSVAFGDGVIASGCCQTVIGCLNIDDSSKAFIIGNGSIDFRGLTPGTDIIATRSNALSVDWNGNVEASGAIKATNIPDPPTTDGTYTLTCTVTNGVPTYSWT